VPGSPTAHLRLTRCANSRTLSSLALLLSVLVCHKGGICPMAEINESSADRLDSSEEMSGLPVVDAELLDQLPVTLEVRIGSVTLSASELGGMQPGAILTLGESADAVRIMAGGQIVARGELVEVDGQLALRILQIINSGPPEEE